MFVGLQEHGTSNNSLSTASHCTPRLTTTNTPHCVGHITSQNTPSQHHRHSSYCTPLYRRPEHHIPQCTYTHHTPSPDTPHCTTNTAHTIHHRTPTPHSCHPQRTTLHQPHNTASHTYHHNTPHTTPSRLTPNIKCKLFDSCAFELVHSWVKTGKVEIQGCPVFLLFHGHRILT